MTLTAASSTATTFDLGLRPCALVSRVRARDPARPGVRVSAVLRPARGRLRLPRRSPGRSIEAGPTVDLALPQLLPVPRRRHPTTPNTEPGLTRLIRADRLAAALGMRSLWVKDDTGNPTHSFKDRVVAVALAAARELGFTGAAPARPPATWPTPSPPRPPRARLGLGRADPARRSSRRRSSPRPSTAARWSPSTATTTTSTGSPTELAAEHEDWAFVNVNVRPYYAEGSKTLGFEVAEQLGLAAARRRSSSRWRPARS